jgi:2,4-dienoyl-CoA reductase-like NADH-dependent reductase (Old Yellow Enzyme family)
MRKDSILFQPITINKMELKNRIGMAPLLNMPRAADWGVSDQTITWFEARAKGGAAFLTTGTLLPLMIFAPDAGERLKKLADAVHQYGAKINFQIGAGGPMGGQGPSPGPFPSADDPKPTQFEIHGSPPTPVVALTRDQMQEIIQQFAAAVKIIKDSGIDAVELHCAHGGATLYCSFISPFYNHRTDEYGGSWENRLRFPVETLKAMREAVGPDYPILARMDADELLGERGITLEDGVRYVAPALEAAGVDCLDVSQGSIVHSPGGITIPMYYPRGCYIDNAAAIKQVVKVPVIGVGRIVDLDMAEKFLEEGKADIIYMGRQLTSDPDTPKKYYEGREDEIRKCIGCLEGCGTPCPINYDIQPEKIELTPAETQKKILIIGGGVAGMEAA